MGIISSLEWASAEITDAHLFFLSSNQFQLLNQPRAFTPFIDHEKDIADIYADATLQIRFKSDITTHRLPVTVECQSQQRPFGILKKIKVKLMMMNILMEFMKEIYG